MTKEMLIAEAPCEIIWTLTSWTAVNTRCASPGIFLRLSPTQQTIALPPSTFTSLIFRNSVTTSQSFEMSSSVTDTLTSDVETTSTEALCSSKVSKLCLRHRWTANTCVEGIWQIRIS